MIDPIGVINIYSEIDLPVWSIAHAIDTTSSNYLKIHSLRQMCILFQSGADDSQFVIAGYSFELFPNIISSDFQQNELIKLSSKADSAREFWNHFKNLHRPIILYRIEGGFTPLFEMHAPYSLRIPSLSYNSPVSISFQGALGSLLDLFKGRVGAARDNQHIHASLNNIRDIVETSQLLNDNHTPPGVRKFVSEQLEAIEKKQTKINKKLGINRLEIEESD